MPYDFEAELAVNEAVGAPEHDLYVAELRDRRYRGDVKSGLPSEYHRSSVTSSE
ncbi:hypothetical protein [Yimella sp. RIT 621]|uniref:hypothetical protein n=1 Tax=Yimella sp. RIT 621 TaxID=2510323 RepID=UPI001F0DC3C8|nr:hypothetical protein [Yimella sp. RIT 621]